MNPIIPHVVDAARACDLLLWVGGRANELPLPGAACRTVLVNGDPTALDAKPSPAREGNVEIHTTVVTPEGGSVDFKIYNVPALNGPADISPVQHLYPRLACLETRVTPSITLDALAAGIGLQPGGSNVLVLDLPGQTSGLLDAASPHFLGSWDVIVLQEWDPTVFDRATVRLGSHGFERHIVETDVPGEAWAIFRRDRRLHAARLEAEERGRLLLEKATLLDHLQRKVSMLEPAVARAEAAECRVRVLEEELASLRPLVDALELGRIQQDEIFGTLEAENRRLRTECNRLTERTSALEAELRKSLALAREKTAEVHKIEGQLGLIKEFLVKDGRS